MHWLQALSSYVFIAANVILHAPEAVRFRHLDELLPPIIPLLTSHHHSLRGFTQVKIFWTGECYVLPPFSYSDCCIWNHYLSITFFWFLFAVTSISNFFQIVSRGFWCIWNLVLREKMLQGSEIVLGEEHWLYSVCYLFAFSESFYLFTYVSEDLVSSKIFF